MWRLSNGELPQTNQPKVAVLLIGERGCVRGLPVVEGGS